MPRPEDMGDTALNEKILHAGAVEVNGRAVLILGKSGSGKSSLALQLIGLGARLVSDDRTILKRADAGLQAAPHPTLEGMIEARHVGLLRLPFTPRALVQLAVDLDTKETLRLPMTHEIELLGQNVRLLHGADGPHFAVAILHCLSGHCITP